MTRRFATNPAAVWLTTVCLTIATSCGSRSQLRVADEDDARPDGGATMDSGPIDTSWQDGGLDARSPDAPLCFAVPWGEAQNFVVPFEARIDEADIVFLVDNTSSMQPSIDAVQATLVSRLIPRFLDTIADVQLAVVGYEDFPVSPYGSPENQPMRVFATSTDDIETLQDAAESMVARGGGDFPESATEALYHIVTGDGTEPLFPRAECPPGRFGAACLREGSVPIVLLFTDAPSHNGPSLGPTYTNVDPTPQSYEATLAAMRSRGFRVLGLWAGTLVSGDTGRADLEALARDTGALNEDGNPIVFELEFTSSGRPFVLGVIDAIRILVEESLLDVDIRFEDVEGDAVDATTFIESAVAARAIPADGAVLRGDRFEDVRPLTRVEFDVVARNTTHPPTERAQRFPVRAILTDHRGNRLRTQPLEVVVPPRGSDGC